MKVFVAGATGVLGRRAVEALVEAGHEVTGVARDDERAALVRSLGATPVAVDLFDAAAVGSAVAGHDAVCNLATHIPSTARSGLPGAWKENDRLRAEASQNLVDAAVAGGAGIYVQESVAFLYADGGDAWVDEDTPLDAPALVRSVLEAEAQAARFTASAEGRRGVVLRFGFFYGDGIHTDDQLAAATEGQMSMPGPGAAYVPSIHVDDLGPAVVAALRAPAGVWNVVDDEPLTRTETATALASAVGRATLGSGAARAGAAVAGSKGSFLARSLRVSNRRFAEATGWRPSIRSAREGWPLVAAVRLGRAASGPVPSRTAPGEPRTGPITRLLLLGQAVTVAGIGAFALLAPRAFHDTFPFGRGWVAADGAFNEHLLRDFGSLNLALALVTAAAAVRGSRSMARAAAAAGLVYGVPHLAYHVTHLEPYGAVDAVANVGLLVLAVGVSAAVLRLTRAPRSRRRAAAVGVGAAPTPAR